jgi:hypothetical protein
VKRSPATPGSITNGRVNCCPTGAQGLGLGRHQPERWRRPDGLPLARSQRQRALGSRLRCGQPEKSTKFSRLNAVSFLPLRRWRSPRTGIDYPVAWRLQVGDRRFELNPLLDDQELDSRRSVGTVYWEGAIRASENGQPAGEGYLELAGYGEKMRIG